MPQVFENNPSLKILVNYTIDGKPQEKEIAVNSYPQGEGLQPLTAWEIGTRYTYRLYYTEASEKKDMIYFSPSTGVWVDGGIIEVRL